MYNIYNLAKQLTNAFAALVLEKYTSADRFNSNFVG